MPERPSLGLRYVDTIRSLGLGRFRKAKVWHFVGRNNEEEFCRRIGSSHGARMVSIVVGMTF